MLCLLLLASCMGGSKDGDGKKTFDDAVYVHQLSDPEGLHPTNVNDASSTNIRRFIFQKLLTIDFQTLKLVPWMAKEMPTMEISADGKGMDIHYELREGMKWDDGSVITPRDVEFSFMCVKNPKVDCPALSPYMDFIVDFQYDETNPNKFTLICDRKYMLWDHVSGNDFFIFQESKYDPNGVMKKFHFADIANKEKQAASMADLEQFAKEFNLEKYSREPAFFSGSGPYKFVKWETGQRLVCERKKDWWGDKYADQGMFFQPGPDKIVFEIVNDQTSAITALKAEKLDCYNTIRTTDWVDLPKSEKFMQNFNMLSPEDLTFSYIGLHIKDPKFRDVKTRRAIAHLTNLDKMNETIMYNLCTPTIGPILPMFKEDYASDIKPYEYNPEKAKALLAEAGWKDSDNDGILDKMIDGKNVPFKIKYNYNQGNDIRKNVGLALQESVRQAGIDIEVMAVEWAVYLERLKQHQIEMWYGSWVADPRPEDPQQIWSTESYSSGGSNYTGWGNSETDKLIEDIRTELDTEKRSKLYHQYQQRLHDDVPYVFLFTQKMRNAVHKRFDNVNSGSVYPGFYPGAFLPAKGISDK